MLIAALIAAGIGLALLPVWRLTSRRGWGLLAAMWLAYAVSEALMAARILCTGECNIRVDLLLFYPILVFGTLGLGIAQAWRAWRRRRASPGGA